MGIGEHRHSKYKDLYGKKTYRFRNLRKWKDFNKKKNSSPYLKCVLRLSCVVHGPIYGRFLGFYVNGFLSIKRFTSVSVASSGYLPRRFAASVNFHY